MKSLFVIASLFVISNLFSQELHIYYDVHNDSMWYTKNGKVVRDLKVRKDKEVYFHLVEFNNYIYSAVFDASNYSLPPAGYGSDSSSFRGFMPQLMGGLFPGGSLPFMNVPIFGSLMGALSGLNPAGGARGDMEEIQEFKEKLSSIQAETESLNGFISEINKKEKAGRLLKSNVDYIGTLCKTQAVAPSLLKQLLMDYFQDVFLLEEGQSFSIKDIEALNEKLLQIPALREQTKKRFKAYENQVSELSKMVNKLKSTDHGIDELYGLIQQYEANVPQINSLISKVEVQLSTSETADLAQSPNDYVQQIQSFFIKYMDISNNDFSYTHHASAEGRYLVYTVKIFKKDSAQMSSNDESELKPVKTIKVKIDTYGEFKMGTSFGINGTQYGEKPQRFFIKDNVLSASDEDRFSPMISSFINMSYSMGSSITPVVSFGIGLPLKSTENTESLAFFLGPGLYLGKKQSFMISGGFMFSKVNRLANGLKVGDAVVLGDGVIPTEKKFDSGYYLGLAYRIGD